MQRWLSLRWMSSSPLRSALCLSPAGKNLPSLSRTSTKYDPLLRKLVSAKSGRHLWVKPHLLTIFSMFRRCHIPLTPPRLLLIRSQAKLCFRQLSTWRIAALELNCQLAEARTLGCLLRGSTPEGPPCDSWRLTLFLVPILFQHYSWHMFIKSVLNANKVR